jgi:ATP-binding cassette, subfamily B, bacterial
MEIKALHWPVSRLGEALEELARRANLYPLADEVLRVPDVVVQKGILELTNWIEWASDRLGIEAEPIDTILAQFDEVIANANPALMYFQEKDHAGFYLLLKSNGRYVNLFGPDLKVHRQPVKALRTAMVTQYEGPLSDEIDRLLSAANVSDRRKPQVRSMLMQERLGKQRIGRCWLLRLPPLTGFWRQLLQARLPQRLALILGVFVVVYSIEILGWGLIGKVTLNGRLDMGWLSGWALLALSLVPMHLISGWLNANFTLDIGRIFKQRLLAGALRVDLQAVRYLGVGQLLGRVMESQALESLALNGGLGVLVGIIELLIAAWILTLGAGAYTHLCLLIGWVLLTVAMTWNYCKRLRNWTGKRFDMTQNLVECMVGHRTRLAQERLSRRIDQEDQAAMDYLSTSKAMDDAIVPVMGIVPSGWMIAGLLGLAPSFVAGTASIASMAIGLGGMLLANRALSGISGGVTSLARAGIAWTQVATLFRAAKKTPSVEPFMSSAQIDGESTTNQMTKLIEGSNIVYRYQKEAEPVLRGVDVSLYRGERILMQGTSGGGKSTLASLLVGLREADSGLLLLNGLDRHTLGDSWHKLVTEAPQFHENHILSGTLAYNLLMGRNWPASDEDMEEAKVLCWELGLGDLLERMPAGMLQMVGETGWQLSHGERSRIFLARALLQNAQLTILDESFAALDPDTLKKCLNCAFKRAKTLIVIAHP